MIATPARAHRIRLTVRLPTLHSKKRHTVCFQLAGGTSMAVYVVTGGGGFIGSHIAEELLRRQQTVKIIDNFSTGKRENLAAFKNDLEIIEADIAAAKNLSELIKGADY